MSGRGKGLHDEPMCRVCGCTNENCSQCVNRTGTPCSWVDDDLCSACATRTDLIFLELSPATLSALGNIAASGIGRDAKVVAESFVAAAVLKWARASKRSLRRVRR